MSWWICWMWCMWYIGPIMLRSLRAVVRVAECCREFFFFLMKDFFSSFWLFSLLCLFLLDFCLLSSIFFSQTDVSRILCKHRWISLPAVISWYSVVCCDVWVDWCQFLSCCCYESAFHGRTWFVTSVHYLWLVHLIATVNYVVFVAGVVRGASMLPSVFLVCFLWWWISRA